MGKVYTRAQAEPGPTRLVPNLLGLPQTNELGQCTLYWPVSLLLTSGGLLPASWNAQDKRQTPDTNCSITNQLLADWSRGRASYAVTPLDSSASSSRLRLWKYILQTYQPPSTWDWRWPSPRRLDLERTGSVGENLNDCAHRFILRNVDDSTNIPIRDNIVPSAKQVKLLGVTIDDRLDFHQHVSIICRRAGAQLRILQRLSSYIDEHSRMSIFRCFVLSNFNYCSLVWNFCGAEYTSKMERIQFRALKFVYNDFNTSYTELLARANLPTLQLHRKREILVEVFKSVNKMSPSFMWDLFKVKDITYNLRSNRNVCLNHCRTKRYGLDSLSYHGAHLWNLLPNDMKKCKDLDIFKASVRNWNEPMCKCRMCM